MRPNRPCTRARLDPLSPDLGGGSTSAAGGVMAPWRDLPAQAAGHLVSRLNRRATLLPAAAEGKGEQAKDNGSRSGV